MAPPDLPPLLLASTSPRRRELLATLGVDFECYSPPDRELPEDGDHQLSPEELSRHNAGTKVDSARQDFPTYTIIAADTIVVLEGQSLGKPRDLAQAADYLTRLAGQTHRVLTALAFGLPGKPFRVETVATHVRFRPLNPSQIQTYLDRVHVLDKAGAYAYQEEGGSIIEGIEGSAHNVIGLPTETLVPWLREAGYPAVCM